MTQNIYDNDEFFAGYGQLDRSVMGLEGAAEWPAIRALLPDLQGQNVLDLGCGYGWFCRWARLHGAANITGMDVSEKMLERAQEMTDDLTITYTRADLEDVTLPAESFHLVYSSLAFHYLQNLNGLLSEVYRSLLPGGSLVFSVEHPIYTAPAEPQWLTTEAGRRVWAVDSYLQEGPRTTDWIAKGVIKHHRTLATYINLLWDAGFTLTHLEEWGPTDEQINARPERIEDRHRPMFLLLSARR